jgi:hypothetical protein
VGLVLIAYQLEEMFSSVLKEVGAEAIVWGMQGVAGVSPSGKYGSSFAPLYTSTLPNVSQITHILCL